MPCASHPAEIHVFVVFRPQAKKQLIAEIDSHGLNKSPSSPQPHHTIPALTAMLAPLPTAAPTKGPPTAMCIEQHHVLSPCVGEGEAASTAQQTVALHHAVSTKHLLWQDVKTVERLRKEPGDISWLEE